ncbi:hypothetical protein [Atrimonas thermophila]|jgi:hypothetical protein|uniref:hypothetical protein n=1 Tax=Atrimonas thermophila TaxID=3064161 RepID=UPI00399D1EA9
MRKLIFLTVFLFWCTFVVSAGASVSYELADEVIGDVNAFPLERSAVKEKLGEPDFTATMTGFPVPLEYYVVEGSEELSHVYLVYGAGDDGQKTYAVGVVMKGIDFATMKEMIGAEADQEMIVLEGPEFVVVDLFEPPEASPFWVLIQEFPIQGEQRVVSTLMPTESLFSYFAAVHPEFEASLRKAVEERTKKE